MLNFCIIISWILKILAAREATSFTGVEIEYDERICKFAGEMFIFTEKIHQDEIGTKILKITIDPPISSADFYPYFVTKNDKIPITTPFLLESEGILEMEIICSEQKSFTLKVFRDEGLMSEMHGISRKKSLLDFEFSSLSKYRIINISMIVLITILTIALSYIFLINCKKEDFNIAYDESIYDDLEISVKISVTPDSASNQLNLARAKSEFSSSQIEKRKNSSYESDECSICLNNQIEIIFLPCQHSCSCWDCTQKLFQSTFKCPLCRMDIKEIKDANDKLCSI